MSNHLKLLPSLFLGLGLLCSGSEGWAESFLFGKTAVSVGLQNGGHQALVSSFGAYLVAPSNLTLGIKGNITDSRILHTDGGPLVGYTFRPGAGIQLGLLSGIAFGTAYCYACGRNEKVIHTAGLPLDGHLLFFSPSAPFGAVGLNLSGFIAREVQTVGLGVAIALGQVGKREPEQ